MPLQKQAIALPLIRGVDLGTANVLRAPDSLEQGTNIEQLTTGELSKRKGFATIATTLTTPLAAFGTNGSVSIVETESVIQTLDVAAGTLRQNVSGGQITLNVGELSAKLIELIGSSENILTYDTTIIADYIYVYAGIAGGNRLYRFDRNYNAVPLGASNVYATLGVGNSAGRFAGNFVFERSGSNVAVYTLAGTVQTSSLFTPGGTNRWDVIPWASGGFAVVFDDGSNIIIRLVSSTFTTLGSTSVARTNVTNLCIFEEIAGTSFYVGVTRSAGASASLYRIDSTPAVIGTRDFSAGTTYYGITGIVTDSVNFGFVMLEKGTATAGDTEERGVGTYRFTPQFTGTTTGLSNPTVLARCGLGSRPFQIASYYLPYVLLTHQSEDSNSLQNCYFLMLQDSSLGQPPKKFVARLNYGSGNNYISTLSASNGQYRLPAVPAFSDGSFFACLFSKLDSAFNLTAATSTFGIKGCLIEKPTRYAGSKGRSFGENTYIASNQVYLLDSSQITPYGFLLYPDPPQSSTNDGAGNVADGAYQYVVVYESYDSKGNLIESAPSEAFNVTYAAGSARTYTVNLNDVGFIAKSDMRVSLYRTKASGTIFFYVNSTTNFTAALLGIVDNVVDSVLGNRRILYTTGGVAENISPPNANFVTSAKNRLWTFETGSTDTIWFSKEIRSGFLPAFSDLLTQKIGADGGEIIALAQIDDKMIVFKKSIIYVLLGDGPNDALIGSFSIPVAIAQGMGCVSARSVIETPMGVFYQSQEGVYLIDRSLTNQFIGRPIYKNDGTIRASVYDPVLNRVIFLTTAEFWIYYVSSNSWYKWTVANPVDIVLENGTLYLVSTTALLKQGTAFQDAGANYAQTVKMGQFAFAGTQGYQRIYRMLLTGRRTTDADATVVTARTYINSNTTATDTFAIAHSSLISGNRFELEIRPSVQRCETMELEITQTASTSGFILSAVTAEVGALIGAGKRSESRRAT